MKRFILNLFSLLIITHVFFGCKKGDNDPAISLRTRKSRVAGEWIMKTGNAGITIDDHVNPPFNQDIKMDGTKAQINETEAGNIGIIYIANYSFYITFKKDGTFNFNENFNGSILEASGKWNFLGGVGETKNKESIVLKIESVSKGYTRDNLFNKLGTEIIYEITELRNKKMTLLSRSKPYIGADGRTASFSCEFFLTQR
ncbi:MAG: hypothetical protein SFY56_05105 [Bacteroidota bacterium]|nr:hypothetical protein [Bacteroidota bacterium]